jgi:hypothetical protein
LKTITLRFQNTFIRAENDEGCYGTGQFDIIVEPIPKSKLLKKEFSVTDPFHHFGIGHLVSGATADYAYAWSTGETTHSIEVSKEGDYTVVVTNEAGCSETRTCNVTLSYL